MEAAEPILKKTGTGIQGRASIEKISASRLTFRRWAISPIRTERRQPDEQR